MPKSKPKNGTPSSSEFGQLRACLAQNGVSQAQIKAVIGTGAQGRSRAKITQLLREWMKGLPKQEAKEKIL